MTRRELKAAALLVQEVVGGSPERAVERLMAAAGEAERLRPSVPAALRREFGEVALMAREVAREVRP